MGTVRTVLAVLAGFALMGILGVGADVLLGRLFPSQFGLEDMSHSNAALAITLAYTLVFCAAGGYVAAALAKDRELMSATALGALIVAATIVNLVMTPAGLPLWWKLLGGSLCGPFTVFGGWLRLKQRTGLSAGRHKTLY